MPVTINGTTGITDADGGTVLSSADIASQIEAEAGTDNAKVVTPLRAAQAIAALGGLAGINIQTFTANGTYTPTTGYRFALIFATGGGAGAGGGTGGGSSSGAPAGHTVVASVNLNGLGAQAVTIGAGGAGQAIAGQNPGGATSVGSVAVARGGGGATTNVGALVIAGGPGNGGTGFGGAGGASFWGGGGGASSSSPGANGTVYGGGGAGAWSSSGTYSGGTGAAGVVMIIEFK
jgi:hypothetical protein